MRKIETATEKAALQYEVRNENSPLKIQTEMRIASKLFCSTEPPTAKLR